MAFLTRIEVTKMAVGKRSEVGLIRKNNEDSYYIDEVGGIFVVADGMGGHENGKEASRLAVDVFVEHLRQAGQEMSLTNLRDGLNKANAAVFGEQTRLAGGIMGTTFSAAVIAGDRLFLAHIGDSRIYRIRESSILQLTSDHSYLAELVRLGELDEDALKNSTQKNVLIKAVGPEAVIDGQYLLETILPEDKLLLCTDGLYNLISDDELLAVINGSQSLQEAVDRLVELALLRGGSDNITVILYEHNG